MGEEWGGQFEDTEDWQESSWRPKETEFTGDAEAI